MLNFFRTQRILRFCDLKINDKFIFPEKDSSDTPPFVKVGEISYIDFDKSHLGIHTLNDPKVIVKKVS